MSRSIALPQVPTSRHAVERFVQRCRPDLKGADPVVQQFELWAVLDEAVREFDWPEWLPFNRKPQGCRAHLRRGDVVFPIVRSRGADLVTTVLVRGWEGDDG